MNEKEPLVIFTHNHPNWLLRRPELLIVLYFFNYLTQLRKWYVMSRLSRLLKAEPAGSKILDIGCGEGQFLFPYANSYPQFHFVGIDKNEKNIELCRRFISKKRLRNTSVLQSSFESMNLDEKYNVAICVGVLQYVQDDKKAIENCYNSLLPGGRLLLYVPITNRIIIPYYKKIILSYPNYETVQNKKRIYTADSIRSLLQETGFTIQSQTATYGFFGTISNELFNSGILLVVNSSLPMSILVALLFIIIYPFILICMLLDFLLPVRFGNGIMFVAQRNS